MYLRLGHEQGQVLYQLFVWDLRNHQKRIHHLRVWKEVKSRTVSSIDLDKLNRTDTMFARLGSGIYSYLDPSLADVWAVSTTSSPFRVMLECEVSLLPPRTKPPRFSSILQSVSHRPPFTRPGLIFTPSISSVRTGRWSACRGPMRSHPGISYSTPNFRRPHLQHPMVS